MTKTTLFVALMLAASVAHAYTGTLIHTEYLGNGVLCTYQLTNGSLYKMLLPGASSCPASI